MSITVSHTFVLVEDQDAALSFYRDVLGLEVRTDAALGDMRWLTVGAPQQPELEIGLVPPGMGHSAEDAQALSALLAKGALGSLIFQVPDCDATFERVSAAGAEVMQEPIDQPYGVRDCAFRDPSGNHIRFSQTRTGG